MANFLAAQAIEAGRLVMRSDPDSISAVIVLAAGQGTRMHSKLPKVMHKIAGKPLLWHALRAADATSASQIVPVLGHGRDDLTAFLSADTAMAQLPLTIAIQHEQCGTGHAVACALEATGPLTGTVLVTYGDVPLLQGDTLVSLAKQHHSAGNAVTVLSAVVPDPTGYGRIVREPGGALEKIVEQRDADTVTLAIPEINSGIYAFDAAALIRLLPQLGSANAQGEQYLTDIVTLARGDGLRVAAVPAADRMEIEGVNDRVQLTEMELYLQQQLIAAAQRAGVTVRDPATTYLDIDVTIGPDTEILPGTHVLAGTVIGSGCVIGPDTTLRACRVADDARVLRSHCDQAAIGTGATVGPFTHLRPGADLGNNSLVGAYVEVKKAQIGAGVKSHHLAYIGDAQVGAGANIGAGVVIANYDGVHKYETSVGESAFIGSNSTLVAPVTVGDGAFVAAGSTITGDVDPGDLAVARGKQRNLTGWVHRTRSGSAADAAAQRAQAASHDEIHDTHPTNGAC